MEKNILLSCQNVTVGYANKKTTKKVATNINFEIENGQLIAMIGENGIGKSTLLKTLIGIQNPISGTILLNQKKINDYSNLDLAQNLSVVLTEKIPASNLTVFEIIALGRQPYTNWLGKLSDVDLKKINEAIQLTNIEHLCDKKHFEISDGQLQIVMIARALAQDTPIIILDEPTTHLDLLHKVSLLKLLKKLCKETNKCILFSSHDIDLAIQISDKMIVMTTEKTYFDKPNNLINQGIFDKLFNDSSIVFDTKKGNFIIDN